MMKVIRAMNGIEGIRMLILSLSSAIPMLQDLLVFLSFFFFVFGMAGHILYSGHLHNRCTTYDSKVVDYDQYCSVRANKMSFGTWGNCASGWDCTKYTNGTLHSNPNYGYTGFDNIFQAWLTIFTIISKEGWSDIMYDFREADPLGSFNDIYFTFLIVFGSIIILSLAVAVISEFYDIEMQTLTALKSELMRKAERNAARVTSLSDEWESSIKR